MDYDEFSKDDFIGGTRVNLYELFIAQSSTLTLRRLLDDRKVCVVFLDTVKPLNKGTEGVQFYALERSELVS